MAKLYELCTQIIALDEDTDKEQLEALQMERNEKLTNIWKWIRNLEGEASMIMMEADRLKARAKSKENLITRLKDYVGYCLGTGTKWSNGVGGFKWRHSHAVEVLDESQIPEPYWRVKTLRDPAKADMLKDLKAGASIPGVTLVERHHLQVD